jgi:hypothetical protein
VSTMASIGYSTNSAFGSKINTVVRDLRECQAILARTKTVMDDVSAGGVQATLLESNTMFSVAAGQGLNFYNAIVSLIAAVGALPSINDLDQG